MRRAGLALATLLAAGSAHAEVDRPRDVARLGTLEKVTARVSRLDVPVGATKRFKKLEITVESCFEAPPTEPPESAAHLTIRDRIAGAPPEEVFAGWMFASSPALSALQHAVYDVWVVDCLSEEEATAGNGEPTPAARDARSPQRRPEG